MNADFYHVDRRLSVERIADRWGTNERVSLKKALLYSETVLPFAPALPYIGLANIESEFCTLIDTDEAVPEGNCRRFVAGQVLYGKLRPYLNKIYIAEKSGQCSPEFYALSPANPAKLLPEFLAAFLMSNSCLSQTIHMMTGNTHPRIQREDFEEILIPLPSIYIQRKLISFIEAARLSRQKKHVEADALMAGVDEYILKELGLTAAQEDDRRVFAVRLKHCASTRVDALYNAPRFLKLLEALNDCHYPKILLGEISPELAGGATPKRGDAELYTDDGVKFLRILNVAPFRINLDDVKHIRDSVHEGELSRSQLATGDVLMTITGRVGTAAVVAKDILPANINQHIVRLRIRRKDCLPEYLAAYLNSSIGNALSNRGVTGGTRIALDYETIRNLTIPLPSLEIQHKVTKELSRRQDEARRLRTEAQSEWEAAKARFEAELLG